MTVTAPHIQQFILIYDSSRDEQVDILEYGTERLQAAEEYNRLQERYRDQPHIEVLLAGATSLDALKVTHSTFFPGFRERVTVPFMKRLEKAQKAKQAG